MSDTSSRPAAETARAPSSPDMQEQMARTTWSEGTHVRTYATRGLRPVEVAGASFELVECLDLEGGVVAASERAPHSSELHYVAGRPA